MAKSSPVSLSLVNDNVLIANLRIMFFFGLCFYYRLQLIYALFLFHGVKRGMHDSFSFHGSGGAVFFRLNLSFSPFQTIREFSQEFANSDYRVPINEILPNVRFIDYILTIILLNNNELKNNSKK